MPTATLFAIADAEGGGIDGTSVEGGIASATATTVRVGSFSASYIAGYYTSLFRFDLSSLSGKYISSASLNLWGAASGSGVGFKVSKITSDWLEVNGANSPTFDISQATAEVTSETAGVYNTISDALIATFVQAWADNSLVAFGVALYQTSGGTGNYTYDAREVTGTANDPYLSVTYNSKPVISNINIGGGVTVPATGDVSLGFSYSDSDSDTLSQVAVRRKRLTGA